MRLFLWSASSAVLALAGVEQSAPSPGRSCRHSSMMPILLGAPRGSMAWPMKRMELTFLDPLAARAERGSPGRRTETFTSARRLPLLHIAVAGCRDSADGAQLGHIGLGPSSRGAQIKLGDDLHQRNAGALRSTKLWDGCRSWIDLPAIPASRLQALDPDMDLRASAISTTTSPSPTVGYLLLADLIALRQIGVENSSCGRRRSAD